MGQKENFHSSTLVPLFSTVKYTLFPKVQGRKHRPGTCRWQHVFQAGDKLVQRLWASSVNQNLEGASCDREVYFNNLKIRLFLRESIPELINVFENKG